MAGHPTERQKKNIIIVQNYGTGMFFVRCLFLTYGSQNFKLRAMNGAFRMGAFANRVQILILF